MKTIGKSKRSTIIAQYECEMICEALKRAKEIENNTKDKEDEIKNNKEPICK